MKYYVYTHTRLDTDEVFYVGVGTSFFQNSSIKNKYARAYSKSNRNKFWTRIVNKTNYQINIVLETDDKKDTLAEEIRLIKLYGRRDLKKGILVNLTDGGDSCLRRKITSETRRKQSETAQRLMIGERKSRCVYQMNKNHSTRGKFGKENHRSIKVFVYNLNMEFLYQFDSLTSAAKTLKCDISKISMCLLGKRKKHGNYLWYKDKI